MFELRSKRVPPLAIFLGRLQKQLHRMDYLSSDPLEFVHRYSDPWDREAVAILAALLAYGNVKQIRASVELALTRLARLGSSPASAIRGLAASSSEAKIQTEFAGWAHRFNTSGDLILLLRLIQRSWRTHGSVGLHFLRGFSSTDADIGDGLTRLISDWKQWAKEDPSPRGEYFSHLLTSPADGSCCKRWCMLLRWMGRKDGLDPGLWVKGSPLLKASGSGIGLHSRQLILPLDTHTGRISQYLGLTQRKTLNWKAAVEITHRLKSFDAEDPTRYDFALARLGILGVCQKKFRSEICAQCQLLPVCKYAQSKKSA